MSIESEDRDLTIWEKINFHVHILYCHWGKNFIIQSKIIDAAMDKLKTRNPSNPSLSLDEEFKNKLNKLIENQ